MQKNRVRNGELYRYIADTRGAFAQPALYEGGWGWVQREREPCRAYCLPCILLHAKRTGPTLPCSHVLPAHPPIHYPTTTASQPLG